MTNPPPPPAIGVRVRRRSGAFVAAWLVAGAVAFSGGAVSGAASRQSEDVAHARAVFDRHCTGCHNTRARTAGLSLEEFDGEAIALDAAKWESVVLKLRTGTMPPSGRPRPDREANDRVAAWLEGELDRNAADAPGRNPLRRLNRTEYANAIRDLLDLHVDVETLLPPDDSAFGFDNIADLQGVSPALLERYLSAADRVSALAVGDPDTAPGSTTYRVPGDQSQDVHIEGLPLGTVGGLRVEHYFPLDGEYDFQITLGRTNLDDIRGLEFAHDLEIAVDGQRIMLETVGGEADRDRPGVSIPERTAFTHDRLRVRAWIPAGARVVTVSFIRKMAVNTNRLRPFIRSSAGTYDSTGRPHVETVTVTGPFDPTSPGDTASRRRIFTCRPDSADGDPCAREIVGTLARRAFRRTPTETELGRLMDFYREGRAKGTFESGIQLALRRVLASPAFVFRIEAAAPDTADGAAYAVDDFELASRLSFFLWSTIPDDELLDRASERRLHEPEVLAGEVRRMLADPRAASLAENFAGQWLHLRNLRNIRPNTDFYPDFDNNLRRAFEQEAEMFFESIVREDRSVIDLLTADYTFVNERLARHYGIDGIYGSRFRRVSLGPDLDVRRGLLGKGGVLLATSHADRTAPVLRGKWILENLLGISPPPPPPNVPALEADASTAPRTMRERMETHRANPACAGCHQLLDPLGFALENFDAVGGWRTEDGLAPVDASGMLADGTAVDGVVDVRESLVGRSEVFVQTLTSKLMTFALGRGLEPSDMPIVRRIVREAAPDYGFSAIVDGIVRSTPFRMRSTSGPEPGDGSGLARN